MSTGPAPAETAAVLGVDVGGTKIAAGLVLADGTLCCRASTPTPADAGPAAVLEAIVGLVQGVRIGADAAGRPAPTAVGIGSAGVIDPADGAVRSATRHLAGWAGTRLADVVGQRTGLPVAALNDVHAHALGEARYGAGRGLGVVLVVAAGTGVGGALVVGGQPQTGAHGAAGHLGHVPAAEAAGLRCSCGRRGHLEAIASGPGLLRLYRCRGGRAESAAQVAAAAAGGERLAGECLATSARALGRAVGGFLNIADPDVAIVTGGLAEAGTIWWDALRAGVHDTAIDIVASCPIRPATAGAAAAILGAATFARQRLGGPSRVSDAAPALVGVTP